MDSVHAFQSQWLQSTPVMFPSSCKWDLGHLVTAQLHWPTRSARCTVNITWEGALCKRNRKAYLHFFLVHLKVSVCNFYHFVNTELAFFSFFVFQMFGVCQRCWPLCPLLQRPACHDAHIWQAARAPQAPNSKMVYRSLRQRRMVQTAVAICLHHGSVWEHFEGDW